MAPYGGFTLAVAPGLAGRPLLPRSPVDHSSAPAKTARAGTVTRRSVVRTAAWTAPVVTIAAASPAYAAASDILTITNVSSSGGTGGGTNGRRLTFSLTVNNTSASDTTASLLQVTLTIPLTYLTFSTTSATGWNDSVNLINRTIVFTSTGQVQQAAPGSSPRPSRWASSPRPRPRDRTSRSARRRSGFVSGAGVIVPPQTG